MWSSGFFLTCALLPLSTCLGKCFQEDTRLECTDLHDAPRGEAAQVLKITNSSLRLAPGAFRHVSALKAALLRGSVRSVEKGSFNELSNLIILDLRENELEQLPVGAFQGANSLEVLLLANNRLWNLHGIFSNLHRLAYLDLAHNNLSHLPSDLLQDFPSIKYLDVSFNPLVEVSFDSSRIAFLRISFLKAPEEVFCKLKNLQVLDLSGSSVKRWPEGLLQCLERLRVLYSEKELMVSDARFLPASIEKYVQSRMPVNSTDVIEAILRDLGAGEVRVNITDYLQDEIMADAQENVYLWQADLKIIQKCLLFSLLGYISLMYLMLFTQIIKSLIHRPYQKIALDEI